jgi:CheY-like chemotaxis protein/two-component sensor histidine kinase
MKRRRSTEDKETKYLDRVEETVRQGEQLVKGLLTFSQKQEPEFKRLDVNRLIRDLLELMRRTMPREVRLDAELAEALPGVRGDLVQLQQALLNLINNARDAIDPEQGGEISIATRALSGSLRQALPEAFSKTKSVVEIEVRDSGSGMDLKTQEHIFEPFFTTKGKKRGSGLGLAMVYGIVREHGGSIECSSKPGKGTSFRILLPALEGREQAQEKEGEDAAQQEDDQGPASILVVEDEPLLREMACEFLEDCGYEVTEADSGEKALELYKRGERFSVVVTDVSLPGMSGYELMSSVSELAEEQKIILVSGDSEQMRENAAGKDGRVDFLQKPFSLKDLQQGVQHLLAS